MLSHYRVSATGKSSLDVCFELCIMHELTRLVTRTYGQPSFSLPFISKACWEGCQHCVWSLFRCISETVWIKPFSMSKVGYVRFQPFPEVFQT